LFVARSDDSGSTFDEPDSIRSFPTYRFDAVMRGQSHAMTLPALPRLTAHGNTFTLAWTEARAGRPELLLATSTDGAKTFSEPTSVHGPEAGRPCFTALAVSATGQPAVAWMESRHGKQQPFAVVPPSVESRVYAGPDGQGICPCCDLDTAWLPGGGFLVAFRNSRNGHRDIYLSRSDDDGKSFAEPQPVANWHWTFQGCPHDGPSLAVSSEHLHVAWMDGHDGPRRIRYAQGTHDGSTFEVRDLTALGTSEQGHPRLAVGPNQRLWAVWDEGPTTSSHHDHPRVGRMVAMARSHDDGATFAPPQLLDPRSETFQTRPEVACGPDGQAVIAWMELSATGKAVVVKRIDE
jgi:hypothetical protein